MTHDPRDEQLAAELERRAASTDLSRDWSRRVLLPAVTSGIDSRPQPVVTSRWSAIAGLAGVAALLLVLVVALPRMTPGPSSTGSAAISSSPGGRPSPVASPPGNRALSAKEFSLALAAGELDGSTLLVHGEIGPVVPGQRGPECGPPKQTCVGRLVGTDPAIEIEMGWIRAQERQGGRVETPGQWEWWMVPAHDGPGTLLVRVAGDGTVEFLGVVNETPSPLPLSVADVVDRDPNLVTASEVFIVDAWLTEVEPPGEELIIDCMPPPPGSEIPGLPNRYCQPTDFLTAERPEPRSATNGRGVALEVQVGAAERFGRGEVLSHGLFAISPRLYAGCFPGPSPCWQWDVIGRLSEAPVVPDPTTPPGAPLTCGPTQPPDPHANTPSATWTGFALDDQTGLVERCEAWEFQPADAARMTVTNPNGDVRVLELTWAEACAHYANVSFNETLPGFEIVPTSTKPDNSTCDGVVYARGLRLYLKEPVAADTVSTRVIFTPAATPTPVATPQIAPEPIACSEEDIHATVYDETGLVDSCATVEPTGNAGPTNVSNVGGDRRLLHINWGNLRCDADAKFRLEDTPDGYRLEVEPGKYGRTDDGTPVCVAVPARYAIRLILNTEIDASDVTIVDVPAPSPEPTDPLLGLAWWELAPSERPTADSRELDLLVFERECANGESPEGRVGEPEIEYGDLSVTITFQIRSAGGGDCPAAPGAPVTVQLSEPLGDRRLVDGGFASSNRVIEHGDGLLWVAPLRSLERATLRLAALLGSDACAQTMSEPRAVDDAQLLQLANDLGTPTGMLGEGLAWVGDAESAMRELGGFELYQDRDRAWYMIGFAEKQAWLADGVEAGDLVLADVTSLPISGGRTIWIPGRFLQTFGSGDCQWDSDGTRADGPRADEQAFDFTLSILAPSASWTVGQSLDGFGATLEYSGNDPIDLIGSSSGGVALAYWSRLDGDPAEPTLAVTADCHTYPFAAGERRAIGMWPAPGFAQNGRLTLPPGIWRLTTFSGSTIGECGGQELNLSASIIVRVR